MEAVTPAQLASAIGVKLYHQLKHCTVSAGRVLLSEADVEDPIIVAAALMLCKATKLSEASPAGPTLLGHLRATLWASGASYRQIAELHGVGFSSVQQSIRRVINDEDRLQVGLSHRGGRRGSSVIISNEDVSALQVTYLQHKNELINDTPVKAASRLEQYANIEQMKEERV